MYVASANGRPEVADDTQHLRGVKLRGVGSEYQADTVGKQFVEDALPPCQIVDAPQQVNDGALAFSAVGVAERGVFYGVKQYNLSLCILNKAEEELVAFGVLERLLFPKVKYNLFG